MSKITAFIKAHPRVLITILVLVLLVVAFAAGRQFGPTKVVTKTETVEVQKVVTQVQTQVVTKTVYVHDVAKDVHKVTTTTKKPDGTVTTTTTVDDKSKSETSASSQQVAQQTVEKTKDTDIDTKTLTITETYKPQWHLGLRLGLGGEFMPGTAPGLIVSGGLQAERRILGPVFMGVWADVHTRAIPFGAAPYTVVGGLSLSLEL